jgi:hypothetical protein
LKVVNKPKVKAKKEDNSVDNKEMPEDPEDPDNPEDPVEEVKLMNGSQ